MGGSLAVYAMRDKEVRDRVKAHVYNPGVGAHDLSRNQNPDDYDNLDVHLNAWDIISEGYGHQWEPLGHIHEHDFGHGLNPLKAHIMGNFVDESFHDKSDLPQVSGEYMQPGADSFNLGQ